eukprot:3742806-Pyramimonas_sp.AAC.1
MSSRWRPAAPGPAGRAVLNSAHEFRRPASQSSPLFVARLGGKAMGCCTCPSRPIAVTELLQ